MPRAVPKTAAHCVPCPRNKKITMSFKRVRMECPSPGFAAVKAVARSCLTVRVRHPDRESIRLGEGCGRTAFLAGAAIRDSAKGFRLRMAGGMTGESRKDGPGDSGQAQVLTRRNPLGGWKATASGRSQGRPGRGCRRVARHRAMMLSAAPAAGRKSRLRIRCEHSGADQCETEQRHQQHGDDARHVP